MVVIGDRSAMTGEPIIGMVFRGDQQPELLQQVVDFRVRVWSTIETAPLAQRRFGIDSSDGRAWHIIYRQGASVIACGRLARVNRADDIPDRCSFGAYIESVELPAGILNRLVVDPAYQGQGLGTRINEDRIALARREGVVTLLVEVQEHRIKTMARHGFTELGPSGDTMVKGDWRIMLRQV